MNNNFFIENFDIVICGGGMVGLAMAAAIADSQLKVALIEKSDMNKLDIQLSATSQGEKPNNNHINNFDLRVSAISPANQNFLSQLNCWQHLPKNRISDYEKMIVWDQNSDGRIHFNAANMGLAQLGSIVENQALRSAIYQQIKSHHNIHCFDHSQITILTNKENYLEITFNNQLSKHKQTIKTQLLIGADGSNSSIRKKFNIFTDEFSYQQTAFVATVETEKPHEKTAWQRFTTDGPVAFLPLSDKNFCSVVWSLDQHKADEITNLNSHDFAQKLSSAFENHLGKIINISDRMHFPLKRQHANSYLAQRCVLIGDAAHSIHPLAGQGVNIGFQDVICLSQLILKLLSKKRDFSLQANLRPYERERKSENQLMQDMMSGFKYSFANKQKLFASIRGRILSSVDNSGLLKENIMRKAMGFK